MVKNIGHSPQHTDISPQSADNGFGAALGDAASQVVGNTFIEKQMTWLDLNTDQELGGGGHHCLKASGKGGCSGAKKLAKLPKDKKPAKLKNKIMKFLKKVKRWNQKRKRQKQKYIPSCGKQDSKSDNETIPR